MNRKISSILIVIAIASVIIFSGQYYKDKSDNIDTKNDKIAIHNVLVQQGSRHFSVRTKKCSYEVYLPTNYSAAKKHPLLVTLSPNGNGKHFYKAAYYPCNKMGFILVGSNDFRNGVPNNIVLPKVDAMIKDVCRKYSIDKSKIYIGGFSGGGMGSYFMARKKPGFFKGLIINNGRIHPTMLKVNSLKRMRVRKVVIFCGKTDGIVRPELLKEQKKLLQKAGVKVKFIEYNGGHIIASSSLWERALKWLQRGY